MLARGADDLLRVLIGLASLLFRERVLVLRFLIALTDFDCVEFVAPDAAGQNLLTAGFDIEVPTPADFHDRQRHRPIFFAYEDIRACLSPVVFENHFDTCLGGEPLRVFLVAEPFARVCDIIAVRPEDFT